MKRTGSAVWTGGLKDGKGEVSTASGVLSKARYGFTTRFEGEAGTNPEEIIAAAYTEMHLETRATVPGADKAAFDKCAGNAKAGYAISRLLNAKITLDAQLT